MSEKKIKKFSRKIALTFDDVLLIPSKSEVLPRDVNTESFLTKRIRLKIPVLSAAMDTVTESEMAIAMARNGGLGVIHRNMSRERQAEEVKKVKKSESWIIENPVTISPDDNVGKAKELMEINNVSGLPVIDGERLVGIITQRDLLFKTNMLQPIRDVMTKELITADEKISVEQAVDILDRHKIEKLLITDRQGRLKGMITVKDIIKSRKFPDASKDKDGRLLVGAATGPLDMKRVEMLMNAGADVIVIDTAHGHSSNVINTIKQIKKRWETEVVGGNIATSEAADDLISAGADALKVGIGPGSICTTRIVAGAGVPQITAIQDCAEVAERYGIPVIADGGIKYSGDIAKAVAAGANCVMIGSIFAGTEESPGRVVFVRGRKYKSYRGMGSVGAMQEGSDRYGSQEKGKFVPEGVEGIVPYRGTVSEMLFQLVGGLRSAMGYCGCKTIEELRKNSRFVRITKAGLRESHPHNITITAESP
ncbi:MAG: IMP dehydrogenase, partial [Candidatus Aenigmatarchaeota archaeon]